MSPQSLWWLAVWFDWNRGKFRTHQPGTFPRVSLCNTPCSSTRAMKGDGQDTCKQLDFPSASSVFSVPGIPVGGWRHMLYLYCCLYRFWVCFDFEFGFPFCQQHPRNLGLCHFEGPGIFRVACFPAQVTYICRCGCVLMLVCCGVFMLAMKAFIFCVYSMANKCANARAIKKNTKISDLGGWHSSFFQRKLV